MNRPLLPVLSILVFVLLGASLYVFTQAPAPASPEEARKQAALEKISQAIRTPVTIGNMTLMSVHAKPGRVQEFSYEVMDEAKFNTQKDAARAQIITQTCRMMRFDKEALSQATVYRYSKAGRELLAITVTPSDCPR